MTQNNYDPYFLEKAINLAKGKITSEKYEVERDITKKIKLREIKELAIRYPYFYLNYLRNLKYNFRLKAIKEVHDLTNNSIKKMRPRHDLSQKNFSGQVDKYLKGEYDAKMGVSFYLYDLAIILDTPVEYFIFENSIINTSFFTEYHVTEQKKEITDIVLETLSFPKFRKIVGYRLIDYKSMFKELTFIRVDKRESFFSFEIYIQKRSMITDYLVDELHSLFNDSVKYIFLSSPLVRDSYKISIFGLYKVNQFNGEELESFIKQFKRSKINEQIYPL